MNRQNEGHMDRLREKQNVIGRVGVGGGGWGGTELQEALRPQGSYLLIKPNGFRAKSV